MTFIKPLKNIDFSYLSILAFKMIIKKINVHLYIKIIERLIALHYCQNMNTDTEQLLYLPYLTPCDLCVFFLNILERPGLSPKCTIIEELTCLHGCH